jgi:hypothetical protein
MRYRAGILPLAMALLASPALAEEIIYFSNGASLAIRGHKVTEGMIHVDMGDDGFIAFPMSMVDRVEKAGQDVYVPPSSSTELRRNQMVEGATGSDSGQLVTSSAHNRDQTERDYYNEAREDPNAPKVKVDENGMAYMQPFPNGGAARQKLRVTGRDFGARPLNTDPSQGLIGARRLGMSQLIGEETAGHGAKQGRRLNRAQLGLKETPAPAANDDAGDQGSQARDGGDEASEDPPVDE